MAILINVLGNLSIRGDTNGPLVTDLIITGLPIQNETLGLNIETSMPNDDNFNFLWYADGDLIGTNATLTLTQDLVEAISAEVSYINMGDSLTVVSAPGLVGDVNDLPSDL